MPLTDKPRRAGWQEVSVLCAAAVLAVCFPSGCGRGKSRFSDLRRFVMRKPAVSTAPRIPTYNRYYTIWWISHSNLKTSLLEGHGQAGVDHMFTRTTQNLDAMSKFLDTEKKEQVIEFVNRYRELQASARPGSPSRRTMSRLDRLSTQIKKNLSPHNVEAGRTNPDENREGNSSR